MLTTVPDMTYVSPHFRERVAQRLGQGVDPLALAHEIDDALRTQSDRLHYIGRGRVPHTACYRYRLSDGRITYVIVMTATRRPVTVLEPGFKLTRRGKRPKRLRASLPCD